MSTTPPAQPGLTDNLWGAADIMLGRDSGLQRMDLSAHGFTWSFAGLLLVVFIDMSGLSAVHNAMSASGTFAMSKPAFVAGKLLSSGLAYLAAMLALYLLCREPSEQQRFTNAVIVHNWAAPIVSIAVLPLLFAATTQSPAQTVEPDPLWSILQIGIIVLLILVGVRLIRISLDITLAKACLFFAVTTAVSLVCADGLERLLGVQNAAAI